MTQEGTGDAAAGQGGRGLRAGGAVGGAIARAFAAEGARLYLAGRRREPVEIVAKDIVSAGGFAEVAQIVALDEQAVDGHLHYVTGMVAGRVDISFNAVGIPNTQSVGIPLTEMDAGQFSLPIMTYATSYFLTARAAARHMIPNRSGVIMTVTALHSRTGLPMVGGYGPAMAAKEALTRDLSAELAPHGVRVVGLRPQGMPETRTLREFFEPRAKSGMTWEQFQEFGASRTHPRRLMTLEHRHSSSCCRSLTLPSCRRSSPRPSGWSPRRPREAGTAPAGGPPFQAQRSGRAAGRGQPPRRAHHRAQAGDVHDLPSSARCCRLSPDDCHDLAVARRIVEDNWAGPAWPAGCRSRWAWSSVTAKVVVEGLDMSAFTVELKNQPGELARLCDAMAGRGVNLVLCATSHGDRGAIAFIVDDEAAGRTVLGAAGIAYTERPALTVRMDNIPGAGAVTFRKLAKAGVNVELLLPVRISSEQFFAVLCVDDIEAAADALGDQVIPAAGLS